MKQLSGLDASFLNVETSKAHTHVASLVILDPTQAGDGNVYANLRRTFEERLHLLEVYRRKLAEVPFNLDHPYWVDDPELDLEFHIREIAVPLPGDEEQLGEQVARIMARPLDRSRPLWELYVISGLQDGMVGLLTKIHHSTIDGASGVELLQILLDTDVEGRVIDPPSAPLEAERMPAPLELLGRTLVNYASRPRKALQLQLRLLRTMAALTGNPAARQMVASAMPGLRRVGLLPNSDEAANVTLPTRPAPHTPWNRAITGHRRFAFRTLPLSDAQTIKRAFGVTVNDVVMALCAGALRRYLLDHDALPDASLNALIPVSVRVPGEGDTFTNRVTGVVSLLHTDLDDPVERLLAIHASMNAAKELQQAIPADILSDITQFAPPALMAQAARLAGRVRMGDRMNPTVNVLISNVPGPRQPLYLSGAEMRHFYPVSGVSDGMGLNMTVQSYLDNLDFGLIACRELVPDLWTMCDGISESFAELLKAV
jgi:diacylglycerol O-acyltransferase / wax synthase